MSWIWIAYFVIAFAALVAVASMDVVEGRDVDQLAWPARIAIALMWPLFLVWFFIDLARGEAGDRD